MKILKTQYGGILTNIKTITKLVLKKLGLT